MYGVGIEKHNPGHFKYFGALPSVFLGRENRKTIKK